MPATPPTDQGPAHRPVHHVGPADVLLADGSVGVIRPVEQADRDDLLALHDEIGLDNLRLRFFSASRAAGHAYVDHLLAGHECGDVIALGLWQHGQLVGLATAERENDSAEVAFVVADAWHGRGVGTLLLEHLAAAARSVGITRFTADVLMDNVAMLQVFHDAGFDTMRTFDRDVATVAMDTRVSDAALEAADARESRSEAASLDALLRPHRVAVVGVRRDGSGVGAAVVDSIVSGGYRGELVVIHPSGEAVAGVTSYPSFSEVPEPVDLVVVAVPPRQVTSCVAEAASAGARAAVVITSGFAEMGREGEELQRELALTARAHDIRVVGPNCLGLLDNQPDVRLTATFAGADTEPGGLAIASQSGGVGIVVLDLARRLGLGVGHFISLGNKADISSNDLLAAWADDPAVTCGALYLESFGNPAKFARVARRFSERKPLLAVVGGRSGSGQRAGASHTAAAATPAVRVDALFAQAGVVACRDAEDLAQTALVASEQPLPQGPRLAVLGNAGGLGVLAADAASRHGLEVPALSDDLRGLLAAHVSGTVGTANPVDAGAGAAADDVGEIAGRLLDTDEVDALLVVLAATRTLDAPATLAALERARGSRPGKPMLVVALGGLDAGRLGGITALPSVESAVRALAHLTRYAVWLRTPRTPAPATPFERFALVRREVSAYLATHGPGWLGPADVATLLAPYDVYPSGVVVSGPAAAAAAAAELGPPVAVKVADPAVVHKTERGLVRAGIDSVAAVRAAVETFVAETGDPDVPVLVQPMVKGVEVALGVVRDPGLGPLVMVAAGGTATEIWQDRSLLLAPVTPQDAARALRSLRIWPLLDGYRGAEPVDQQALVDLVVALGRLAVDVPEIAEADLNPVLATPTGVALVDVKLRLADSPVVDAGVPRRLREPV
jgi:acyl-CoA synthetase (NDP forming)/GNAT superfamily N-acetyltransferase